MQYVYIKEKEKFFFCWQKMKPKQQSLAYKWEQGQPKQRKGFNKGLFSVLFLFLLLLLMVVIIISITVSWYFFVNLPGQRVKEKIT